MPFVSTSESPFLRGLGIPCAELPHISALLGSNPVLSEDAVSETKKAPSKISGGTPGADVSPEMQWLVVHTTVTHVIGLAAKITSLGTTLVVGAVCQDQTGVSYTLKDLPIGMARGPPVWRFLLAIPDDSPVHVLLGQLWPNLNVGLAVGVSKRLAELVRANAPPGRDKKLYVRDLNAQQLKHLVQEAWGKPGAFLERGRSCCRPSSSLRSVQPSMICRVWDWGPNFCKAPWWATGRDCGCLLHEGLFRRQESACGPHRIQATLGPPCGTSSGPASSHPFHGSGADQSQF